MEKKIQNSACSLTDSNLGNGVGAEWGGKVASELI